MYIKDAFDADVPCSNCTEYEVHAAFYVGEQRARRFQPVGVLTREAFTAYAPVYPNARLGFNGRHFRVGTNLVGRSKGLFIL